VLSEKVKDGDGKIVTEQPPSSVSSSACPPKNVGHQSLLLLFPHLHPSVLPAGPPCCPPSLTGARSSRRYLSSTLLLGVLHHLRPWKHSQIRRTLGQNNGPLSTSLRPHRSLAFAFLRFAGRVPRRFTSILHLLARTTGSHKRFLLRTGKMITSPSNLSQRAALRPPTTMLWLLVLNECPTPRLPQFSQSLPRGPNPARPSPRCQLTPPPPPPQLSRHTV
jgi:hypothetical protein